MTAADYRIIRAERDGVWYTPVTELATGRWLDEAAVTALSATPTPSPRRRCLEFILADESAPVTGAAPLDLRRVRLPAPGQLLLAFAGTTLAIGTVEAVDGRPPGSIPETVGRCLVARAVLADTLLAAVCWQAVQAGTLRGICAGLDRTTPDDVELLCVWLGPREESCLSSARVVRYWAEDAAGARLATAMR